MSENPSRRQWRGEGRGSNPEAEASEVAWKRARGLFDGLLETAHESPELTHFVRDELRKFRDELEHLYSDSELRTYRLYNLIANSGEAGHRFDFLDQPGEKGRIERFIDDLYVKVLDKKSKKKKGVA